MNFAELSAFGAQVCGGQIDLFQRTIGVLDKDGVTVNLTADGEAIVKDLIGSLAPEHEEVIATPPSKKPGRPKKEVPVETVVAE
jgi:hypothetical protein